MNNQVLNNDLAFIHDGLIGKHDNFIDSTIVVTGCAGFLGFYFLQYLIRYGDKLKIKKDQLCIFKGHGIPRVNVRDIYDNSNISDVVIHLEFI